MPVSPVPTEDQEQAKVVDYCDTKGYPRFRIPNETFTRSWKQKNKNKALGVSAGVPDLGVIVNNRLIFIELKRSSRSRSRVSAEQEWWIEALNVAGVPAKVCYGAQEAIDFINSFH